MDGQPVTVPANVGISIADQLESPMHAHDTTGVIHIESSQPSNAFTLGALFDVWGVKLTPTHLGGYHNAGGDTVHVYANGKVITDPTQYALRPHDNIVIGYEPGTSLPHIAPFTWPPGE